MSDTKKLGRFLLMPALVLCALTAACASADPPLTDDLRENPPIESTSDDTTASPHVHIWGEWECISAPSCVEIGEEERRCPCGAKDTHWIPKKAHTPGEPTVVQSPTCASEGLSQTVCTGCGKTMGTEAIPKTDHAPGEWVVVSEPTCAETGLRQMACTGCGEVMEVKVIPKTDHISGEWTVVEAPACFESGLRQTVCTLCGTVTETEPIAKVTHTPGEWIVVSEPTSVLSGEKQLLCSVCRGTIATESIPEYALSEAERVAALLKDIQSESTFTFAALADLHVMSDSNYSQSINTVKSLEMASKSLAYLEDRIQIEAAVFLGDYTAASRNYTAARIKQDFVIAGEHFSNLGDYPVAWLRGNHEINYYASRDRLVTDEELYEYVDKNSRGVIFDPDNPHGGYGYIDFPEAKIRMICLNTVDALAENPAVDGQDAPSCGISSTQLSWLAGTALNFTEKEDPSAWGIIVLSHHPLDYINQLKTTLQLLEAYRNQSAGELRYTVAGTEYAVAYDFINITPAEILCSIHGHNHNFNSEKSGITEPWLWRFCMPNMTSGRENESASVTSNPYSDKWGDFDEDGNPVYYKKYYWSEEIQDYVYDDENGTSYCMITVDRENKKIYAHYVGVGRDRVFDYSS